MSPLGWSQALVAGWVVARAELLPASSSASTATTYIVPHARPDRVARGIGTTRVRSPSLPSIGPRVPDTVTTVPPSTDTRYPVTPTLSLAWFHSRERLEVVRSVTVRSVGVDGGSRSGQAAVTTQTGVRAERFPLASTASTSYA